MQSVTQTNDIEEIMQEAELADREFVAEKQNTVVLFNTGFVTPSVSAEQLKQQNLHWNTLKVPRRSASNMITSDQTHLLNNFAQKKDLLGMLIRLQKNCKNLKGKSFLNGEEIYQGNKVNVFFNPLIFFLKNKAWKKMSI